MSQNNELVLSFLKKSFLRQKTDINNPDVVIKKCISLAYKDMMIAGKYYLDSKLPKSDKEKTTLNNGRKDQFLEILKKAKFTFSRKLILDACEIFGTEDEIENSQGYATRYGFAQKLVNMTFKYFYVFQKEINKTIDFSQCDCPLDSIIINNLGLSKNYTWSKLTSEKYKGLQDKIDEKLKKESEHGNLGRLLYDFQNW